MDAKTILTNKCFCPMPWTGLMYNFNGEVKNCIRSDKPIGNIKNNTIQEILLGEDNLQTQSDMLDKKPGSRCFPCYNLETGKNSFDIISDRIFYIKELRTLSPNTYQYNSHDLRAVDIRWTNLCNFACVYCTPDFSSKWASELKKFSSKPNNTQLQDFKDYIFSHAHQLKHVYMAGGEPLQMRKNEEFLDILAKTNPDVHLRINTNLSKTNTTVFEKICGFKNVHWTVSVETIEQEFEYIRYGGSWLDFLDNLGIIRKLNHKISFNMLHFLLNFMSIFDCVNYLKGLGFQNNSFIIGPLLSPLYLNIRHLPENILQLVLDKVNKELEEEADYLYKDSLVNLASYIQQPFKKDLVGSMDKLAQMDKRRNLNNRQIFTALYNMEI